MKNLNKVLAMVLVVVMAMTSVVFADFTDVAVDTDYAEAINVGAALGLFNGYEDGTFKPEGEITRAEFAAIVVRALNQEAQAASAANAASDFADVAEDHWAKGYINIVSKLGIVNGYGDGNFGPEDLVLYEQAIKMLVVALGYEPAIGTAGYPVGYLTKASEIGLNEGVKATNGLAANRGVVAQLTINALNIPLMMQSGYGTWVEYNVQDGTNDTTHRTLLSENLGMVKLSGIVESTSKATSTASHVKENVTVEIVNNNKTKFAADDASLRKGNKAKIYAGETDISSLVGVKAVVYASYDELNEELVALYAGKDLTKVEEIVVAADEINVVNVDANNNVNFEYWENETDKKPEIVTLPADAAVYVNGAKETTAVYTTNAQGEEVLVKATSATNVVNKLWTSSNAPNFYGQVTLQLLNDQATGYDFDTIFIENFKTIVVDSNNTTRYRITAKNDETSFSYDPEAKDRDVTLYDENGYEMDFADLVENDVFTFKEYGTTKTVVEAYKVSATVSGSVTSIDNEKGEYTIGGEVYEVSPYITAGEIVIGDEGTFYLDLLGNIVDFEITETVNTNYAYVVDIGLTGTLDKRTVLKLFTFDGQYGTINTASKVKVDGISNIDSLKVFDADNDGNADLTIPATKNATETANIVAKQGETWFNMGTDSNSDAIITSIKPITAGTVITYAVNSSGYITAIDRATALTSVANKASKGKFSEFTTAAGKFEYNEKSEALDAPGGKLYITDNTVIMVAPTLNGSGSPLPGVTASSLKEDDFTLFNAANIADEQEFLNARAFNVDEDKNVGFILVETDVEMANAGAIVAVATGFSSSNDEAGDTVIDVKAVQDGEFKAITTKSDDDYGLVKFATFIPKFDAAGKMSDAKILATVSAGVMSYDADGEMNAKNSDVNSDVKYYFGKVTDVAKREFTFLPEATSKGYTAPATESRFSVDGNTNVYVYYSGANSSNMVTIEDYSVVAFEDTDRDGIDDKTYFDTEVVTSVYAVAREYEGDIIDLVLYVIK